MLLLDSVQPEKWYSVKESAAFLGLSEDTMIRQVNRGLIQAFCLPNQRRRSRRPYVVRRIQGCELIRYIRNHMGRN